MKIPDKISAALKEYQKGKELPPANLFNFSIDDLLKMGYKRVSERENFQDNDIIVGSDTDQDLFILVDNAAVLRKSLKKKSIESVTLQVYRL